MKETEVLRRINDVDPELIEEAEFFTKRKRNVWKVFLSVTVCLLLVTGIVLGVFIFNGNSKKEQSLYEGTAPFCEGVYKLKTEIS